MPHFWKPISMAPKNQAGEMLGPTILIYNQADGLVWPAYWGPTEDCLAEGLWCLADGSSQCFHTPDVTHWMEWPEDPNASE